MRKLEASGCGEVERGGVRRGEEKLKVKVTQSCLILCNPMDYIVHGNLQARILE